MILALLLGAAGMQPLPDDLEETACFEREYSQQGMTMCAGEAYERADAQLQRIWAEMLADARVTDRSADNGSTDSDQRSVEEILNRAQHAWTQYRDAQCEYEGLSERGGSIEPMMVGLCLARLTRERTRQLSPDEN